MAGDTVSMNFYYRDQHVACISADISWPSAYSLLSEITRNAIYRTFRLDYVSERSANRAKAYFDDRNFIEFQYSGSRLLSQIVSDLQTWVDSEDRNGR